MKRSLLIKQYRNIGIEEEEEFVLNSFMEKGKMGNLVIVIGENNSGKSNILDALLAMGNRKINMDRDATNLRYEAEYQKPKLVLKTENLEESYGIILQGESNDFVCEFPMNGRALETSEAVTVGEEICASVAQYGYGHFSTIKQLLNAVTTNKDKLEALKREVEEVIQNTVWQNDNRSLNGVNRIVWEEVVSKREDWKAYYSKNRVALAKKVYKEKYGIDLVPQVLRYDEKKITQSMLHCSPSDIQRSSFMVTLFQDLKVKIEDVQTAYNDFRRTDNKGVLQKLERSLNKKLKKVSDKFNRVYFFGDENYKFAFCLESGRIDLSIFRGEEPMNLDYQSLGFRWFFNLYFNLLCTTELHEGDVIVMDDPPFANLSVNAQPELRKALKEFAIRNGVSIVIATQSPFVIDLDYLDELRVVLLKDNRVHIENDFSAIHHEDPNSLAAIKRALTVNQSVLLDEDKQIVFVEGITDYNYMVAFKNILGEKYAKLCFLPIGGIGNRKAADYKERQLAISKELKRFQKRNPILMVDGDSPGEDMKKLNKDSALKVFTLSEVDEKFKEIEDLFDKKDKDKFKLEKKSSARSAQLKTYNFEKNGVEKETLANFTKLFDHIFAIND
ncbi:MAG: AAA family ATPase [Clostridia bacterium]|nr:AAA family ATPase [Clostridia bacterium]